MVRTDGDFGKALGTTGLARKRRLATAAAGYVLALECPVGIALVGALRMDPELPGDRFCAYD